MEKKFKPTDSGKENDIIIPVTRQILTPPELAKPRGFQYGLMTNGGREVDLFASPTLTTVTNPNEMPIQMADALTNMLLALINRGGNPQDITSFTMMVSNIEMYRDPAVLKELAEVWKAMFGRNYFPTKLIGIDGRDMQINGMTPLIQLSGVALIEAPKSQSQGTIIRLGGQNGFDEQGKLTGDIFHQLKHIMRGLKAVLREGGKTFAECREIKLDIFVSNEMSSESANNIFDKIRAELGNHHNMTLNIYKANAFFEPEAKIEIDGVVSL